MKKSMSKLLFLTAVFLLILLLISFRRLSLQSGFVGTENEPAEIAAVNEIVFVNIYENYAWGWDCYGCYIDNEGYMHSFDLSGNPDIESEDEYIGIGDVLDLLENGYDYGGSEVTRVLSEDDVRKCCYNLLNIQSFGYDKEYSQGCDMGETSLYGVIRDENGDRVIIPLVESGDWNRINTDEYALEVCKILGIDSDEGIYHGLFKFRVNEVK